MKLAGAAGISKRRQQPSQNADRGPDLLQSPSPSIYGFSSFVLYDAVSWPSSIASHHSDSKDKEFLTIRHEEPLLRPTPNPHTADTAGTKENMISSSYGSMTGRTMFKCDACSSSRHVVVQYDAWLSNETVKARNSILRAVEISDKEDERLFGEYTREVLCLLVERDDGLSNIDEDKRQLTVIAVDFKRCEVLDRSMSRHFNPRVSGRDSCQVADLPPHFTHWRTVNDDNFNETRSSAVSYYTGEAVAKNASLHYGFSVTLHSHIWLEHLMIELP
ncbi:hypothetical protein EDD85DRAFT_786471 [Armillaria nabsnona]|nr:hypothetical protein EDD85DRAFT_786471 [Armillaria nabsnona]